jgi:ABC-2 type transport system ATP-binding protein
VTFGVRSLHVRFGDVVALDDITIDVVPGAVVAVVGGDGAGKTTLLRTLVREIRPDAGEVSAPAKADIGFLPASSGSWAALTVRQNLEFAGGIFGLSGDALAQRIDQLLAAADLQHAAGRLASQLSGGMRRKLGFCMAIVAQPALLVLDEPSTGVDPVSRVDLWRLTAEAAASGTAVIMSTTYLDEAERAATLVVLDKGRALVQGPYDAIRAGFRGAITHAESAIRPEWSWRRGRDRREYWPDGNPPPQRDVVEPDLEDIVIALSLIHRAGVGAAS